MHYSLDMKNIQIMGGQQMPVEVKDMRGRTVHVARSKIGGVWWNVGTFATREDAEASLAEHWNTPDVTETRVDAMVVR